MSPGLNGSMCQTPNAWGRPPVTSNFSIACQCFLHINHHRTRWEIPSVTVELIFVHSTTYIVMQPATANATKPLQRLAWHSTTTCAAQASAYGKCILATYTDVKKDICREEFAKFGACLREAVSPYT